MTTTIDTRQPSLAILKVVPLNGVFPSDSDDSGGIPMGCIRTFAGSFAPGGTAAASGQLLSIAQNTALFSLFGTTYGGDGVTTFALPDLDVRAAIGHGQGPGLDPVAIGEATGSPAVTIAQGNLPTGTGGTSLPFDEDQPSLGIRSLIRVSGIFPSGFDFFTMGAVVEYAGGLVPGGYMEADGRLLNIADFNDLFSLIGTTYGGDGIATFALPDLRGRTIVGTGNGHILGEVSGLGPVTLGSAQLPAEMGGGGQPVNNADPSLALNYIVALQGIFPSQPGSGGLDPTTPIIGEITAFAGNFAPNGWALCQGQLLSINTNQALFSLLGTTWGGNGVTTFALPDLSGRSIAGAGDGVAPGTVLGSDSFTIAADNIPDLNYAGTGAGETLYGGNGNDTIDGLAGNDTIRSNGGTDTLLGGLGSDVLDGGGGADNLAGGGGNENYYIDTAGDTVSEAANEGIDRVWTALAAYTLGPNVEQLIFEGDADHTGRGNALDNRITGGVSDDRFIVDSGGADIFSGGLGTDTMDFRTSAIGAIVDLTALVHGGAAAGDTFNAIETYFGSLTAADTLTGNGNENRFDGFGGADRLSGAAKNDTLNGGDGNDELNGGAGRDRLSGGAGADDFNYSAASDSGAAPGTRDIVVDFEAGIDDIDVSAIDARAGSGGNNAFSYIGAAAFSGEGQIRAYQSGASAIVEFNTAGSSGAEITIQFGSFTAIALTAADFVL